jgi:C-terminal processing protease CtpA/Prc
MLHAMNLTRTWWIGALAAAFIASPLAAAPGESNLVVFDAACQLIEENYFDQNYLKSERWLAHKSEWRGKIQKMEPRFLYVIGLGLFAGGLPSSHVSFSPPLPPSAPKKAISATAQPTAPEPGEGKQIPRSSSGYEIATIRRGAVVQWVIDDVQAESPAARAGLRPGWWVLHSHVDIKGDQLIGVTAKVLPFDETGIRTADRTGRPPGVKTSGDRDAYIAAHAVNFTFLPAPVPTRSNFETRLLGNITYLRFDGFDSESSVMAAMVAIDKAGPAGLIIDLRRNHGGRLGYLSTWLGRVVGNWKLLGNSIPASKEKLSLRTLHLGSYYQGRVVVLVGPSSMSAAEIAAASIQDLKRGKIIGRRTAGSVLSSQMFDLPDGGRLMIPTLDFERADGRRIEGVGVEPDIWVLPTIEDIRHGRDPALERALAEIG